MKIKEIDEGAADDLELALTHYAEKKHREHELKSKGSEFKKAFYKGKDLGDKMVDNPVTRGIQKVGQWVHKQNKPSR